MVENLMRKNSFHAREGIKEKPAPVLCSCKKDLFCYQVMFTGIENYKDTCDTKSSHKSSPSRIKFGARTVIKGHNNDC